MRRDAKSGAHFIFLLSFLQLPRLTKLSLLDKFGIVRQLPFDLLFDACDFLAQTLRENGVNQADQDTSNVKRSPGPCRMLGRTPLRQHASAGDSRPRRILCRRQNQIRRLRRC